MGRGDFLGEFEQIVMLAVARLKDDAYGMRIRGEIAARTGRNPSLGAVYATLDRLTDKGVVHLRRVETTSRARWFFTLTSEGVAALARARDIQNRMWAGVRLPQRGGRS
jgi:DNA-binding PadR family transcriptional regulator